MSKDIKDYLHLYLGCEISTPLTRQRKMILTGVSGGWTGDRTVVAQVESRDRQYVYPASETKLILRPLSDMTEDEIKDIFRFEKISNEYKSISFNRNYYNDKLIGITIDYLIPSDDGDYPMSYTIDFSSMNADDFVWCLKHGFDLFGLIESGLAIDKTII